ncbi:MAG: hypothetical protein U0746_20330 [Gemmataceae bacterium]
MSLLGKILAVFNVLAAIAFLALAGMDYQRRHVWSYQHFRYQLALNGLPVDNTDDSWRRPGEAIVSDLSDGSLTQIFNGDSFAQGKYPKTQTDAAQGALEMVKRQFDEAPTIDDKRKLLAKFLIPLQTKADKRDDAIEKLRAAKDQAALDNLFNELEGAFKRAASPVTTENAKRDLLERRSTIADVLFNLDPSKEWHDHVQRVVGAQEYTDAAARQAKHLLDMTERYKAMMADDKDLFVHRYQAEMPQVPALAKQLEELDKKFDDLKALLATHTTQRNARKAAAEDYAKRIDTQAQAAVVELATLVELQNRLFALQQEFALTMAANERLVEEIRAKEQSK